MEERCRDRGRQASSCIEAWGWGEGARLNVGAGARGPGTLGQGAKMSGSLDEACCTSSHSSFQACSYYQLLPGRATRSLSYGQWLTDISSYPSTVANLTGGRTRRHSAPSCWLLTLRASVEYSVLSSPFLLPRPPPPLRLRRYNVLVKYRREVPSATEACNPWLQHADNNQEYEGQQNLTAPRA